MKILFRKKEKKNIYIIYVSELTGGGQYNARMKEKGEGEAYCVKRHRLSNLFGIFIFIHRSFVRVCSSLKRLQRLNTHTQK